MRILILASTVILGIALAAGYRYSRIGLETPQYSVLQAEGPFEVRQYPSLVLVSTPMGDSEVIEESSFMRLFGYISGENQAAKKISMTTPVLTSQREGGRRMSFIVPKDVVEKGAPAAVSADVEVERMNHGRFAAYRFSGAWSIENFEAAKASLAGWIAQQKFTTAGEPIIANYDPPFTPSFLRRNEILVRLQE